MPQATFLVTDTGESIFVHQPCEDMQTGPGERLEVREISDEQYALLSDRSGAEFKLYSFTQGYTGSHTAPPAEINYRLLNLQARETFNKGLRVAVEYYGSYGASRDWDELVVGERHEYVYMPHRAIPLRREMTIEWYLRDGSVGFTKRMTKHFLGTQGAKVHEKRKEANVMNLKAIIYALFTQHLGESQGLSRVNMLFGYLFQPIETYVKGHEGFLIDAVAAYQEEVFDYPLSAQAGSPTIRQFLISELDIPKYIPEGE